jgi:uncharacterized protein
LRFVDASVFLHAYLTPQKNKRIPQDVEDLKRRARSIIKRINDDKEKVMTSLVHVSEIANILGARISVQVTCDIISSILNLENLEIVEPSKKEYESAIEESRLHNIGVNDALAWILMRRAGISEIYSFDGDFDEIENLKRLTV